MKKLLLFISILLVSNLVLSQNKTKVLDSIVITSSRIELPFQQNSRTIVLLTAKQIKESTATNVVDLLQQAAGIDIRRRGVQGMQADLYIRGGSFDQTLLLIDGIKVEDPQTGHHTLNIALPLAVIERVEIIKGPAARVFGQNAFTGAINIVTKKSYKKRTQLAVEAGSFGQANAQITVANTFKNGGVLAHFSKNTSDGYRFNTDFNNINYFIKSTFHKNQLPIDLIASFSERKFGANGFYASPAYINQYEETQASLFGVSTVLEQGNLKLKPKMYWKRNQDMYVFLRENPAAYRNLHISNKVGALVNGSYTSNLGITGFGVDIAKVWLSSNNLGKRSRIMATLFAEHRFKFLAKKLDVTPGVALNYFSDFKFHAFPGIDVGYQLTEQTKLYANAGYTYRIPTYTDLYYSSPTTIGNENLKPETAISEEIGLKFNIHNSRFSIAGFHRNANNLIDYVKENQADKWEATNIQKVSTLGIETTFSTSFNLENYPQNIRFGYTYLDENLKKSVVNFSRYSINSLQHHFTATYQSQFLKNLTQSVVYKYAKRINGEYYQVLDAKISFKAKRILFTFYANNILNEVYTETNLVPMPKRNFLVSMQFNL